MAKATVIEANGHQQVADLTELLQLGRSAYNLDAQLRDEPRDKLRLMGQIRDYLHTQLAQVLPKEFRRGFEPELRRGLAEVVGAFEVSP